MKKLLSIILLGLMAATGAQAQLLYKISGNGLEKPSYIIGTHHLANVGFVNKINGVKEALTETDQVYGEVVFSDMTKSDTAKMIKNYQTLPSGQTIKTVLTAEQFKAVDACLKKLMDVGFSSSEVMDKMGHMTPQALATQMQSIMFMMKHMGEYDPSTTFDQYFQAQAKKNNEPIGGLESVKQQCELLYTVPMKRQIEQLMCVVNNQDFYTNSMEKVSKAFYNQDLDALKLAQDEKLSNTCDATAEEQAALVDNRNADWMTRMPAIMAAHPTFFAVGAGHLPGDKGLLQLLKNAGYTVEGVN